MDDKPEGGEEPGGGRREAEGGPEPVIGNRESGIEGEEHGPGLGTRDTQEPGLGTRDTGLEGKEDEAGGERREPESRSSAPSESPVPSPVSRNPEEPILQVSPGRLRSRSRRDFLLFGAGTVAAVAGFWWLLPDDTRRRHLTPKLRDWLDSLDARLGATPESREGFLNRALTFDDDVAEALYSPDRRVRTYSKSQVTPLRNNYNGRTPGPEYLPGWSLMVSGLASGRTERLTIADLRSRLPRHEQVTRICCVEGWSAVAWWGGLRFADFLAAFPPAPGARWAKLASSVNLDFAGRPDPYYVSIDLPTARHPQTLLATELSGRPLPLAHGAPLRLLAPMKLGLKNIKAITSVEYTGQEPADYWNERGYSKYDGI
jgi:DMSO/TMAO reductase YedYZ molybdopterin-dependent catalytic subunit